MFSRSNSIAVIFLVFMFTLMFASAWNDSAITDELAHIPAGYSYLTEKDMRLNPEHPPLIKDLAALPLVFLGLSFPTDHPAWTTALNGQWDMGRIFLYESGNDADQIIFWARIPMMLLAVLFGWILYAWTRRRFGSRVALLSLFLLAFSPTFLAHSRYVTTDLAAAFGFLIGIMAFIDILERPTRKRIVIAGIALGVAQLLKFSVVLLLPVYAIVTLLWILSHAYEENISPKERLRHIIRHTFRLLGKFAIVGGIALFIIALVYEWHIWNYPPDRQLADAQEFLSSFGRRSLVNIDFWLIEHRLTRGIGQYILGVLMVVQRAAGGNTTYFLGEVTNTGWTHYFPVVYALKETLALHILTIVAIGVVFIRWGHTKSFALGRWIREHSAETTMLVFIAVYWWYSIRSPLNIGVRHVLPTFPFIYILVSKQIVAWIGDVRTPNPKTAEGVMREIYYEHITALPKQLFLTVTLFWIGFSVLTAYPYYLSYFNGIAGVRGEGYRYAVDSNFDWGQDLKRLRDYVDNNHIDHIAVDYFGAGDLSYYFGEKVEPWWSSRGAPSGYFAISASFRQGAYGKLIPSPSLSSRNEEDLYIWLRSYEPIARAGQSIFIYKLP
ncbi:MAG: hypothetical protein COU90_00035 [Candidatus Ryanbacteria bacterium CG10_big_fil_rev_8_21_14_0_10_43_42]|uniref:Glycosyltransferase RgtA/B/C/D-like domain-containing protein n=1 Tax=Candidatus Ryanbacteria bacterium CG10_big_fil_rev_8_21_14_0_10_43_42 TaxID=1974864 RepID=A0A2M8KY89_9BACT|nr:MAG: hypothetical protein COU90_00035 [Candidatus Ryanbacteria bacterium CG10_big_fil_rev_8_21_14_0_10_43_42]